MKKIIVLFCLSGMLSGCSVAVAMKRNDSVAGVQDSQGTKGSAGKIQDTPFGVLEFLSWNHSWNNFKYKDDSDLRKAVKLMKEAGVSIVRMDFYWNDIEPQKGNFDFAKYDRIVELLSAGGIDILALLHYSAGWAAPEWNNPPDDSGDFVNYAEKTVSRYKDKIKYWELWNEPDSPVYWQPQDGMVKYSQLLKAVYPAIKKIDPSCKVLLGGLTNQGYFALKNLYRLGGKGFFDIVNIHPFINPLEKDWPQRVQSLHANIRRLMAEFGDGNKKIWFTEIGCPGVRWWGNDKKWWEGRAPSCGQQARFVADVYGRLLKLDGVEKIFWAFFRDNKDHFKDAVDYFGLVRWDFSRKPAFYAYKKAYSEWRKKTVGRPRQ